MNPVSSMWEWATLKQCILKHVTNVQQWWINIHSSIHCKLWLVTKSQMFFIVTFYHENDMHRAIVKNTSKASIKSLESTKPL